MKPQIFFLLAASLLLFIVHKSSAAPAADRVVVVGAPLGEFGFGTGTGGPLWRSKIGHLVINVIQRGGPADRAGLHKGDEILSVDGLSVPGRSRSEVFEAMSSKDAGQIVVFRVAPFREGKPVREVRVRPVDAHH